MNIVIIGGGTGTIPVITGLKKFTQNISVIVTMADSGGHSGYLRDQLGILPPGDVRNCIVSLADEKKKSLLRKLLDHRIHYPKNGFEENVGNLMLTALADIYGSFPKAVVKLSELLEINGKVIPVTTDSTHLIAKLENGRKIYREKNIDTPVFRDGKMKIQKVWLKPIAKINPQAEKAIMSAEIIVLGPGDLFTSIIPNLLVKGVSQAIRQSKAKKIYCVNLMTKFGETHNYKAIDFIDQIENYLNKKVLNYVIINSRTFSNGLLQKYAGQKSFPVLYLQNDFKNRKYFDYSVDVAKTSGNYIRHDADKLARAIMFLALSPK